MKITTEKSLRNFDFWGGAAETVKYLTDDELDQIESILENEYPDGMDETELNDFFWFEDNTIAEWLGYTDFEEVMHRNDDPEGRKCPKCGKELALDDYETFYDEENEDTSYYIICNECGYNEMEDEDE